MPLRAQHIIYWFYIIYVVDLWPETRNFNNCVRYKVGITDARRVTSSCGQSPATQALFQGEMSYFIIFGEKHAAKGTKYD